jgi:hypothetical protein
MRTVTAQAGNVQAALCAARRLMGVPLKGHREVTRSGGEDGLYRSTLESGDVVEITMVHHASATAEFVSA